ncbi:hypothetical protein EON76_00170 [bacterium]|nr:MAG: hypothetical protein EON76_00170 [bacterium]
MLRRCSRDESRCSYFTIQRCGKSKNEKEVIYCYNEIMTVIDDYFQTITPEQAGELERIRSLVKAVAPDVEELIDYGIPAFKYKGKYMIGFAVYKKHMSLFPSSEPIEVFEDQLMDFEISKGTIQFTLQNKIPTSLLKKIIAHRIKSIDAITGSDKK